MAKNYLTLEELQKVLNYFKSCKDITCKNSLKVFLLCCYTGLPLHLILKIKYGDINDEYIMVDEGKLNRLTGYHLNDAIKEIIGDGHSENKIVNPVSAIGIHSSILEIRPYLGIRKYITIYCAHSTYNYLLTTKK